MQKLAPADTPLDLFTHGRRSQPRPSTECYASQSPRALPPPPVNRPTIRPPCQITLLDQIRSFPHGTTRLCTVTLFDPVKPWVAPGRTWLQLGQTWLQLGQTWLQLGRTWLQLGQTWLQLGQTPGAPRGRTGGALTNVRLSI